jgi:hypothetical protein
VQWNRGVAGELDSVGLVRCQCCLLLGLRLQDGSESGIAEEHLQVSAGLPGWQTVPWPLASKYTPTS